MAHQHKLHGSPLLCSKCKKLVGLMTGAKVFLLDFPIVYKDGDEVVLNQDDITIRKFTGKSVEDMTKDVLFINTWLEKHRELCQ